MSKIQEVDKLLVDSKVLPIDRCPRNEVEILATSRQARRMEKALQRKKLRKACKTKDRSTK
jgi:hypothetical protein